MRGRYKQISSSLFCSARSVACFPVQHKEVISVILPVKNHLVLYFENKQTSYPIHMVNINIILSSKYTGISSDFFFYSSLKEVTLLESKIFWGFGTTTCCLKSITCFPLSSTSNDSFGSLQVQVLSTLKKVKISICRTLASHGKHQLKVLLRNIHS